MGWASRLGRQRAARARPGVITGAMCSRIAAGLEDGLKALDVKVGKQHDLGQMIANARMLAARGDDDIFARWSTLSPEEQRAVGVAAFQMEQAERLAATLGTLSRVTNAARERKWFKGAIDRLRRDDSQAMDHLFELEVAGRLARTRGLRVSLEEPDISLHLFGDRVALACKRPRSVESMEGAIRAGRHQCRDAGGVGVILVSTDVILHRPRGTHVFPRFKNQANGLTHATRELDGIVQRCSAETEAAFAGGVSGLIYLGLFSYVTWSPSEFRRIELLRRVVNHEARGAYRLLERLKELLSLDAVP